MKRPLLRRRLEPFGTTIFTEMSARALATGSVNLGQGFPDIDGPGSIARRAMDAVAAGEGNQYTPLPGVPPLRHAVARHQQRFYGLDVDPDSEVLVTVGATEAIASAIFALTEPGDEVIAFEPFYDSYAATIAMAGATLTGLTLRPSGGRPPVPPGASPLAKTASIAGSRPSGGRPPVPPGASPLAKTASLADSRPSPSAGGTGFRPDLDELASMITGRTRLLLINTPHNPTGMVLTAAETRAIADLAIRHDLLVVTDEVYEHLTYDVPHIPIATLPGMRERTVTISSGGKAFGYTGWKVGWATGTPELVTAVRTAKQFLTFVGSGPLQFAIAEALDLPDEYYREFAADLKAKRDLLSEGLREIGFEVFRSDGTYFVTTDITSLGESDGIEFCLALPARAGVVAIPSAVFYDDKEVGRTQVRFAFCKRRELLEDALNRLSVLKG